MAAVSGKYVNLEDLQHEFVSGHIIIEETLFKVDKGFIVNTWDLAGGSPEQLAMQAREEAELSNRHRIVYDSEGVYSADVVSDEGELVTAYEAYERMDEEDKDDYDSLAEYYLKM